MHFFQSLVSGALLAAPLFTSVTAQIQGHCDPLDVVSPNPIGKGGKYKAWPAVGVVNGTTIILPINYTLARQIVPSQYPILKKQYKAWLPSLGANLYPAILQMEINHDIYKTGVQQPASADYQRASISFPFVDRLNDGYTAMTFEKEIIITSANTGAQTKFGRYGGVVAPGYFASCNAYEYENGTANLALPPAQRGIDQAAWANTNTDLSNPDIAYRHVPVASSPYPLGFYRNVTNQPVFSFTEPLCDNQNRLPSTVVSTGKFAPVHIQGDAAILSPFFQPKAKTVWTGVYGLKWANSYYENGQRDCSVLKGISVANAPS